MKPLANEYCYPYARPAVTVDMVLARNVARRGTEVLLIRRGQAPYRGRWALPGGFVDADESLENAARRELLEETGVQVSSLRQIGAFGDPGRDPRGHTVSVAYLAALEGKSIQPIAGDDARAVEWFALESLPALAFDHARIIAAAVKMMREAVTVGGARPRRGRRASSPSSPEPSRRRGTGRGRSASRAVPARPSRRRARSQASG